MRRYLIYLLKTKWLQTLILGLIVGLFFMIYLISFSGEFYVDYGTQEMIEYPSALIAYAVLVIMLGIVIVFLRFASLRNPKEVDLYYAIPFSRKKLLLTHYIFGLAQILMAGSIAFFMGFLYFVMYTHGSYREGYVILYYVSGLLYSGFAFTLFSAVFLRAKTVVDGIVFVILLNVMLFVCSLFFMQFEIMPDFAVIPYYGMHVLTVVTLNASIPAGTVLDLLQPSISEWWSFGINMGLYYALAGLAFFLTYRHIHIEKTESIGDISTDAVGYRLMIPCIILFGTIYFYQDTGNLFYVLALFLLMSGFIGYFIMRRSFKLHWIDVILVLLPFFTSILFIMIVEHFSS